MACLLLSVLACGRPASQPLAGGQPGQVVARDEYPNPDRARAASAQPPAPAEAARLPTTVPPSPKAVPPPPLLGPQPIVALAAPPFAGLASVSGFSWPHNRLISADGSLDVTVGTYQDCTGNSPIDADRADLDPCFLGRRYFVGHNPGVFAALLHMRLGSVITWYDSGGLPLRLRVVAVRDIIRNSAPLLLAQPDVVAQFQTCLTVDGTKDRVLDAVRA